MLSRMDNLIKFADIFGKTIIIRSEEIEAILFNKKEDVCVFTKSGRQFMFSKKEYGCSGEVITILFCDDTKERYKRLRNMD